MHGMFIIGPEGRAILDRHLSRFVTEYSDYVSRKHLTDILPKNAVILWRSGYRCLFKIKDTSKAELQKVPNGTFPTALSVFPDYGIQFITADSYYYYEPRRHELKMEDAILHTLLIDPESQTYATYALLLAYIARDDIDADSLLANSRKYQLEGKIKNLVDYIKSHGKKREWPLPKLNELQEQAAL